MSTPIDKMLDGIDWKDETPPEHPSDVPHVTRSGVLTIAGLSVRCYQLSDGNRVFDIDDIQQFFVGGVGGGK